MTTHSHFHFGLALNAVDHEGHDGQSESLWQNAISEADKAGVDFVTLADRAGSRSGAGQSPLDAILLAARLGPLTRRIGILPSAVIALNEPFHLSTAIATLDYVTNGRAGFIPSLPQADTAAAIHHLAGAGLAGHPAPRPDALLADATAAVQAIRQLWDSWEDDAIVRDAATGRYIDRNKLHYIRFQGPDWSILGPSIVPRPPQGQPPIAIALTGGADIDWAARSADIVFIPVSGDASAEKILRSALNRASTETNGHRPRHYADLTFSLDPLSDEDGWTQDAAGTYYRGTPDTLAERIVDFHARGYDGVRVHPRNLTSDLQAIDNAVLPRLRDAGLIPGNTNKPGGWLRTRLGLPPAINRHREENAEGAR